MRKDSLIGVVVLVGMALTPVLILNVGAARERREALAAQQQAVRTLDECIPSSAGPNVRAYARDLAMEQFGNGPSVVDVKVYGLDAETAARVRLVLDGRASVFMEEAKKIATAKRQLHGTLDTAIGKCVLNRREIDTPLLPPVPVVFVECAK